MDFKKRILKALMFGAVLGILTEFIIRPAINNPIEKKIEEIL